MDAGGPRSDRNAVSRDEVCGGPNGAVAVARRGISEYVQTSRGEGAFQPIFCAEPRCSGRSPARDDNAADAGKVEDEPIDVETALCEQRGDGGGLA